MTSRKLIGKGRILRTVSTLALGAAVLFAATPDPVSVFVGSAFAEEHSGGGQGQGGQGQGQGQGAGGQGGQGGQGGHDDGGHDDGGHDDGGHDSGSDDGSVGSGQGGNAGLDAVGEPDSESDGKGPQAGASGSQGGKPSWAQEGIPEVELGRLSVARSPDRVLDQALAEALTSFTPEMADFYNLPFDAALVALANEFDSLSFIDSPLQNLALFKDALDGTSVLSTLGVTTSSTTLLAIFLGTASDKTVEVTPDTAYAVVKILVGAELTEAQAISLAAAAEEVRVAILEGHG